MSAMTDSLLDEVRAALLANASYGRTVGFHTAANELEALSARLDGMVLAERDLLQRVLHLTYTADHAWEAEDYQTRSDFAAMLAEVGK